MSAATGRRDPAATFAMASIGLAAVVFAVTIFVAVTADGSTSEGGDDPPGQVSDDAVADPSATADDVVAAAAEAMGDVTSVEFELERTGAPVYVDPAETIALEGMIGQFTVPDRAAARLAVEIDGNLDTFIGAIAVDGEVWITNPVTGDFETLPPGFDVDPSRFFDPEGGWQPLLANLQDVQMVGIENRGGERYHVRGTAPAEDVSNITVGLVEDQDVVVDLWIHPETHLVTAIEFDTTIDGERSHWNLELYDYGEPFTIEPPENVRP